MGEEQIGPRVGPGVPVSWLEQSLDVLSRAETPLDIGRTAAEIYAYLADFPQHVDWAHTYLAVETLTPSSTRLGSRFRVREKQDLRSDKLPYTTIADREGLEYVSEIEVTALEPHRRIAWRSEVEEQPFSAHWEFLLEPVSESITTVRMRALLTSSREAREAWIEDLRARGYPLDIIARQVDRAMHNIRTILEDRVKQGLDTER